jgi:hypothetical protein
MQIPFRGLILLLVCLFISCLERQDHEVTAPETPKYDISGLVQDYDSNTGLNAAIVKLDVIQVFHASEITTATDTTDSTGKYLFPKMVPGRYTISAFRESYLVLEEELVLQYEPKTYDLRLPKPLVSTVLNTITEYGKSEGIYWKYVDNLARVVFWKSDPNADTPGNFQRIDEGNFTKGFSALGQKKFAKENALFHGLTFLVYYWTIANSGAPTVFSVNPGNSQISGSYSVPYELTDLTTDGKYLFGATASGHILKFDGNPQILVNDYFLADEKFGGLAWFNQALWTGEVNQNLVIKRKEDLSRDITYRPIYIDPRKKQHIVTPLTFLTFDYYGNLWIANNSGYYKFEIK